MCHNVKTWNWEPLVSVGPVRFGEHAAILIEKYGLCRPEFDYDTPDWEAYQFPESETLVNVESCCVASVSCHESLFYKGQNLFGLSLDDLRQILGKEDEISEIIGTLIAIDYLRLGIQLSMKNDVVVSATCYGKIEDE